MVNLPTQVRTSVYFINLNTFLSYCKCKALFLVLFSGEFCEVATLPPSPCQLAQCQNSAPCEEKTGIAICHCPPGFEGQSCEKLVSVNFVDKDSYVQLQDIKNWPQTNITLQVRTCTQADVWTQHSLRKKIQFQTQHTLSVIDISVFLRVSGVNSRGKWYLAL